MSSHTSQQYNIYHSRKINVNLFELFQQLQDQLICCISFQMFKDPVLIENGYTFQNTSIRRWFHNSMKSPLTGDYIKTKILIKNLLIKKTIDNYSKSMKKSIVKKILSIKSFQDQIQLIDSQIIQLNSKILLNLGKKQIIQNQINLRKQFDYKINEMKVNFMNQGKKSNKVQNQTIPSILQKIIENMQIQQIQKQLQTNQIYHKLDQKQIQSVKHMYNKIDISANAYKLKFYRMQINIEKLIKEEFPQVEILTFHNIKIDIQQLDYLLMNINKSFPNVIFLEFIYCKMNDQYWKVIVDNINELSNIQALFLQQNQIQSINEQDLQQLSKIKQLKYLDLVNNDFDNSTNILLKKFRQNNKLIKVYF